MVIDTSCFLVKLKVRCDKNQYRSTMTAEKFFVFTYIQNNFTFFIHTHVAIKKKQHIPKKPFIKTSIFF